MTFSGEVNPFKVGSGRADVPIARMWRLWRMWEQVELQPRATVTNFYISFGLILSPSVPHVANQCGQPIFKEAI